MSNYNLDDPEDNWKFNQAEKRLWPDDEDEHDEGEEYNPDDVEEPKKSKHKLIKGGARKPFRNRKV